MVSRASQRVFIKEAIACQRYAAQEAVVESTFNHVGVFAFAGKLQHTMVPLDEPDRGTGFSIGGFIRQIIIFSEAFIVTGRSDAACQIHAFCNQIVPQAFTGFEQCGIVLS